MARKKQGWHRADIKAALAKKGLTLRELSQKYGYHQNSITVCFKKPWPAVEQIIAQELDVKPCAIWPERYENGLPKSCRATRNNYARKNANVYVQSEKVA